MTEPADEDLARCRERIAALERENDRLREEAAGVAAANVHAAMQLLELSEGRERELQQKNAEIARALQVAESASVQKSRFLANMSHELRTPISGIVGLAELLLGSALPADARDYALAIGKTADSFLGLINQLLDFCKLESGKLDVEAMPFDLWDIVESVAQLLHVSARPKGVRFEFRLAADVPRYVVGDALRVRQVLLNLGANAVKFTGEGSVALRVEAADRGIVATVTDTGCGFDAATAARLFQPFVQGDATMARRFGGTGLGLAISRQLVERMGGELACSSRVGVGSTFTLRLPLAPVTAVPGVVARRGVVAAVGLDACCAEVVADHLQALGYGLVGPGGGADAPVCRIVQLSAADSIEAVADTARGRGDVPVLLIVPPGLGLADVDLQRVGVRAVLRLPLRPSQLLAAMATVTAEPATAPGSRPAAGAEQRLAGLSVLVAEDTEVNRKVIEAQLRRLGCRVDLAMDGSEAIARLRTASYDVVLMDLQMPRLDGLAATAAIRSMEAATGRRTPIVALTANALPGDREHCLQAGMDDYLAKPVRQSQLAETLARWRKVEVRD